MSLVNFTNIYKKTSNYRSFSHGQSCVKKSLLLGQLNAPPPSQTAEISSGGFGKYSFDNFRKTSLLHNVWYLRSPEVAFKLFLLENQFDDRRHQDFVQQSSNNEIAINTHRTNVPRANTNEKYKSRPRPMCSWHIGNF